MKKHKLSPRLVAGLLALVLVAAMLPACQREVNLPLALGWHRIPNLFINPGPAKVGRGYPTTTQGAGDLYVDDRLEVAGDFDLYAGMAVVLGADEKVYIDGDTTNQTQTDGALDIDVETTTDGVTGFNVAVTAADGMATGEDAFGGKITLTADDTNADLFGLLITGAASTNAGADSYEYLMSLVCAENTAGACEDGVLITAGATDTAMTDGVDVSDGEIEYGVNIGPNPILGSNADRLFLGLTDHNLTLTGDAAAAVTFIGADNEGAADTVFDTTGAGTVSVGSVDVLAVELIADTDVQIQGGASGNVDLSFHDYADSTNDDQSHGTVRVNCSNAATGAEECEMSLLTVTAGGVPATQVNLDASANEMQLIGVAAGNVVLSLRDYADTTTDDMGHAVLTGNCSNTGDNTEECDLGIATVRAGVASTAINVDADAEMTLLSETQFELVNAATGSVELIFQDYADTTTDDLDHVTLAANCTDTGATEDCDFTIAVIENAAAAEVRFNIDADGNVEIGGATNDAVILLPDTDVQVQNQASGNVSLDLRDYADSTADDMAHASFIANCSNTGDNTEECDLGIATVRAGVASTAINIDADAEMTLLSETEFELQNAASGNVSLIFQDYADTATDDLDHVVLTANCTDATATEDCDFTIGVVENATAAETRFHIDADAGIILGSANTNTVQLLTDSTGDAEIVLPTDSISTGEVLDNSLTFTDISDSSAVDADTIFTMGDGIELELRASHTTGDTEVQLINMDQVTDGTATDDMIGLKIEATSESAQGGDTIKGIVIDYEEGTANTIMDAGIEIDNDETTPATLTDGVIVKSSGVDTGVTDAFDASDGNILNALNAGDNDVSVTNSLNVKNASTGNVDLSLRDYADTDNDDQAHGVVRANCSGTGTGAEECEMSLLTVTAGGAPSTQVLLDASANEMQLIAPVAGNVDLSFRDYADTDNDDQAHALLRSNCSTATTGAEDCDFSISVPEAGSAVDERFLIDADDGVDIGSTTNANVTLVSGADTLVHDGDLTLDTDATGGNALAKNEFIGLPRIKFVALSTMADGTTNTVTKDMGDSQTPATDWTADPDADVVMSNDGVYYREGTASLKMAVSVAGDDDDGCINLLDTGDQNWTDDEAVGFWFYADTTLAGDELDFNIHDSGPVDSAVLLPAYGTADVWVWTELDISGVANASKDVIENVSIRLTAAGATKASGGAFNVYFDFIVKWDVAEEESLGVDIPYDGVLSLAMFDATTTAASNSILVEYVDYFVHYQSTDAIVIISDQSDADRTGLALIAY